MYLGWTSGQQVPDTEGRLVKYGKSKLCVVEGELERT